MRMIRAVMGVALLAGGTLVVGMQPHPSEAISAPLLLTAGNVHSDAKGLDKCNAPNHSEMQAFWSNSDWYWWGIYIGGSNMGCANTNVTASWISQEVARGWRILPIWVGPQPPCTNYSDTFPYNVNLAYSSGSSVAQNAWEHADDDLNLNMNDLPIVYDLEAFDSGNSACLNAAKAFIRGWTHFLQAGATPQVSGLYGSVGGSALDAFYPISPNPDFVWGAYFNGNPDVGDFGSYVLSNHWPGHRHKQYLGNVSRTHGGVTLVVDENCSNGPLYGNHDTPVDADCT